jgi:hypothetical protein
VSADYDVSQTLQTARSISEHDVAHLREKDAAYGGSWKKRGGRGVYFMLARKADRFVTYVVGKFGGDVFAAYEADKRDENLLNDIGDLRRYLVLEQAHDNSRMDEETDEFGYREHLAEVCRGDLSYLESEIGRLVVGVWSAPESRVLVAGSVLDDWEMLQRMIVVSDDDVFAARARWGRSMADVSEKLRIRLLLTESILVQAYGRGPCRG